MPRKKRGANGSKNSVKDFRHEEARRKNNPPAGIAPSWEVRERQATHWILGLLLDKEAMAGKVQLPALGRERSDEEDAG